MEAMRLSMLDEEERRKKSEKEAKAQAKKEAKDAKSKRRSSLQVDTASGGESAFSNAPSTSASAISSTVDRSSSPRTSLDVARTSLDNARAVLTGKSKEKQQTTASSRTSIESSNGNVIGVPNTKPSSSSFLKMPPMQRNDSTASMAQHNLMPPMVPAKAPPGQAVHREAANKPEIQRTYSDLL